MNDITTQIKVFRNKLKNKFVVGAFSKTSDPAFIEAMGFAGFDFVIIDLEHGPNTVETAQNLIRAAQISGLLPIVRVKEGNLSLIGEVLDIGAGGVQVPQILTAEHAKEVVSHSKFYPEGMRGVCRFVRAADYSAKDRFKYFFEANETIIVLQLEGKEALNNIESILNISKVDIIFIGPYDLSQSLGVPGKIDHPIVEAEINRIIELCASKGIAVGTFVDSLDNAKRWIDLGIRYVAYSVDTGIFYDAAKEIIETIYTGRENSKE